ncbi:hypothetical protein KW805_04750 [Candidatus Pacearchaeota archaeon]|nr:hypothetical protein [Candidatus Pacearchaeota archaeon]
MNHLELPRLMNNMANSNDILIEHFLKQKGIVPSKMLGEKINQLEKELKVINLPFDGEHLIQSLRRLNDYWIIVKHGFEILNVPFAYVKEGVVTKFDEELINTLTSEFTENQGKLMQI